MGKVSRFFLPYPNADLKRADLNGAARLANGRPLFCLKGVGGKAFDFYTGIKDDK